MRSQTEKKYNININMRDSHINTCLSLSGFYNGHFHQLKTFLTFHFRRLFGWKVRDDMGEESWPQGLPQNGVGEKAFMWYSGHGIGAIVMGATTPVSGGKKGRFTVAEAI